MKLLLYVKDAPTLSSSYGRIADELVVQRLAKHRDLDLFCTVGVNSGAVEILDGTRKTVIYPPLNQDDFTGQDVVEQHAWDSRADMVWIWSDVWPFRRAAEMAARGAFLLGFWCFVDYDWRDPEPTLGHLRHAVAVVPTSVWLENRLLTFLPREKVRPAIRLGVNTDSFRPLQGTKDEKGETVTKARLRRGLGFPDDCFSVGIVAMNQAERKSFEEQLEGLRMFRDANPDIKLRVHLHSFPSQKGGYDLGQLVREMGMTEITSLADPYRWLKGILGYGDVLLNRIYNGLDILMNCSSGESPGLPILEAQAAGVPVLATDYTCMPEHVAAGGLAKVKGTFRAPEMPTVIKAVPDPESIADQLERIMNSDQERLSKTARGFALEHTWDRVLSEWLLTLEEIAGRVERESLRPPPPGPAIAWASAPA